VKRFNWSLRANLGSPAQDRVSLLKQKSFGLATFADAACGLSLGEEAKCYFSNYLPHIVVAVLRGRPLARSSSLMRAERTCERGTRELPSLGAVCLVGRIAGYPETQGTQALGWCARRWPGVSGTRRPDSRRIDEIGHAS
jgi:hypothetical protein